MSTDICRWLFLLYFLSTWAPATWSKELRVVCYYTNWSVYRPGAAKFSPQNINPYLCTHLVYAFGGFTKENTLKPFDKYQDIEKGGYAKFTGLKTYNKNLKTMLAIGGWNEGSSRFSPMVASSERRKELVKNAVKFLRQNHFDGLDLDWEYPSFRDGGKSRDRDNYAQLVQELREEFEREAEKTGRARLLLTMAVPAGIEYVNKGYDVPKLTKYLDWMNILSYDYHSAFEPALNHHAPLFSLEEPSEYNYDTELNIDYTIQHYLEMGADPNKLVMGIPTYGRSYTLFNPDANDIGSPADGPGDMGDATRENGYLAYYEICDNIKSQNWEVVQPNPDAMGPYAYKDNQWVGYDDDNIARKKAEYVAENNLGGIMFWSIDNDDFRGNCHGKPYPIIEAAKEALIQASGLNEENLVAPPTKSSKTKTKPRERVTTEESTVVSARRRNRIKTKASTSSNNRIKPRRKESRSTTETSVHSSLELVTPSYTTPAPPSTPDQGGVFKCEDEGFYPHPKDCKKYFWCLSGAGDSGIIAHQFTCPAGLYFNKAADSCDYTQNVLCNKKLSKATTTTTSSTTESTTKTTTKPTSRVPPKITAATARTTLFRSTTTTANYDDEYEYEDDDLNINAEEDPRVIKELLDLIKKAGGIEQLEKQLKIHEDGSASLPITNSATTPSSISKTLFQKVLSRNSLTTKKNTYAPINRNSRGPQNEGLVRDEKTTKDRGRLQYSTITRQRPQNTKTEEIEEGDEEAFDEENEKKPTRRINQPEYVNIRRPRVSTTTEKSDENSKSQLNRNKILGEEQDENDEATENADRKRNPSVPQYVNIRRPRPSTTEESSTSKYTVIRRSSTTERATEVDTLDFNREDTVVESAEEESVKRRGTTTEKIVDGSTEGRKRGTTTQRILSIVEDTENDLKSKYKTIARGTTTTTALPTSDADGTDLSSLGNTTTSRSSSFSPPTESDPHITTIRLDTETEVPVLDPEQSLITTPNGVGVRVKTASDDSEVENATPHLQDPRPFSISTRAPSSSSFKPVTETATRVTKVSENNYRLRTRHRDSETAASTEKTTQSRTRAPSRFRLTTSASILDQQASRSTVNPSLRARKRFSTTSTTASSDNYEEYDLGRTYRPSEIADLSSLTAVDFAAVKEFNRFGGGSRQRRPRPSGTPVKSTTTTEKSEESVRTSSRTLPVARKFFDSNSFGKGRPSISKFEDQIKSSSDLTTTHKVRGFTKPVDTTPPSQPKANLRNRKIIRRFRPTSSTITTSTGTASPEDLEKSYSFNPIRRRVTRPTSTHSPSSVTSSSNLVLNRRFTRPVTINTSDLSTTTATIITTTTEIDSKLDTAISRLLNEINDSDEQNETSDDVSAEDGENIKLSESNIRENNDVNNNNVISEDGKKLRRKVLKRIKSKTEDEEVNANSKEGERTSTEPNIIVRTRKIVRKLKPTEATLTATSAISTDNATEEADVTQGRKRKIFRRVRPTSTHGTTESTSLTTDEKRTLFIRGRQFTTPFPIESDEESTLTEIKYKSLSKAYGKSDDKKAISEDDTPKFKSKYRGTISKTETYQEDEDNLKSNVKVAIDRSKYSTINRGTTSTTSQPTSLSDFEDDTEVKVKPKGKEEEEEEEEEEENEKIETQGRIPKYRILKPNLHEQNEEDEEHTSTKYRIFRPSLPTTTEDEQNANKSELNSDLKSKTSMLKSNLTSLEDEKANESKGTTNIQNVTIPSSYNITETEEENTAKEEDDESDVETSTSEDDNDENVGGEAKEGEDAAHNITVKNYKNPILERQKNRPVFVRPKITTQNQLKSNLGAKPRYKSIARSTTTPTSRSSSLRDEEDVEEDKTVPKFVPKSYNRNRYTSIARGTTSATTISTVSIENISTTTANKFNTTELDNATEVSTLAVLADNSTEAFELTTIYNNNDIVVNSTFVEKEDSTDAPLITTAANLEAELTTLLSDSNISTESSTVLVGSTDTNTDEIYTTLPDETSTLLSEDIQTTVPPTASTITAGNFADTDDFSTQTTTPAYRAKSTLRSILNRPRFLGPKKSNQAGSTSTTTSKPSSRYGVQRTATSSSRLLNSRTTPSLLRNRFAAKYSTTLRTTFKQANKQDNDEYDKQLEEELDVEDGDNEESDDSATSKPNRVRTSNRPGGLFRKTTPTPKITEHLSDINTEAVKNRNKSLFSKKRKMNIPVSGSTITIDSSPTSALITEAPRTTLPVTKPSVSQETTEYLTTLHHVFSETEPVTEKISTENPPTQSSNSTKSKVERLIEVNRIVEVHAKEETKNTTNDDKDSKVLDKIGAINRVTVIKVVDPKENEIADMNNSTNKSEVSSDNNHPVFKGSFVIPEMSATVREIPHSEIKGSLYNIPDSFLQYPARQDRKFEIYGDSKVADYSQKGEGKLNRPLPNIIDGISHINIITPRPYYNTEASTISLEGLFRTEGPPKSLEGETNSIRPNTDEELLETENSRYVNIRVLGQDRPLDEVTMRAEVVEVSPRKHEEVIKIVPIKVEMSKRLVGSADFATKFESGVPKVALKLVEP